MTAARRKARRGGSLMEQRRPKPEIPEGKEAAR